MSAKIPPAPIFIDNSGGTIRIDPPIGATSYTKITFMTVRVYGENGEVLESEQHLELWVSPTATKQLADALHVATNLELRKMLDQS